MAHRAIITTSPPSPPAPPRPSRDQQMAMLRTLLADRFKLQFHREEKEFSIYNLTIDKSGAKLKPSTAPPNAPADTVSTVYPDHLTMPARNATMRELASVLQRAARPRPPSRRQNRPHRQIRFRPHTGPPTKRSSGGELSRRPARLHRTTLLSSRCKSSVGLKLEPAKGPVQTIVVDSVSRYPRRKLIFRSAQFADAPRHTVS